MQMIYGRNGKSNHSPPFVISQNKNKDLKGELWYLGLIQFSPKTQSNGDPVCWPACLSGKWLHGPLHRWAGVSFCCYVMSTPLVSWCFFSYFVRIKSDLFNCTPHCSAPKWKSANEPTTAAVPWDLGEPVVWLAVRYALKKKRYYLGIFPNMGGWGVFPNPKTFVNLPSIFLYAKFILRC